MAGKKLQKNIATEQMKIRTKYFTMSFLTYRVDRLYFFKGYVISNLKSQKDMTK